MSWMLSGRGVASIVTACSFLLRGMIIPLPLFPDALQGILAALPFAGMVDMSFRLFSGHRPPSALPVVLARSLGWAVGLVLLGRFVLRRARRRVVVQGQ